MVISKINSHKPLIPDNHHSILLSICFKISKPLPVVLYFWSLLPGFTGSLLLSMQLRGEIIYYPVPVSS